MPSKKRSGSKGRRGRRKGSPHKAESSSTSRQSIHGQTSSSSARAPSSSTLSSYYPRQSGDDNSTIIGQSYPEQDHQDYVSRAGGWAQDDATTTSYYNSDPYGGIATISTSYYPDQGQQSGGGFPRQQQYPISHVPWPGNSPLFDHTSHLTAEQQHAIRYARTQEEVDEILNCLSGPDDFDYAIAPVGTRVPQVSHSSIASAENFDGPNLLPLHTDEHNRGRNDSNASFNEDDIYEPYSSNDSPTSSGAIENDIESLLPDQPAIPSNVSSRVSRVYPSAIHILGDYFARSDDLEPLLKEILQSIGAERLTNQFRKVLKTYYAKLQEQDCNEREAMALRILRKRSNRARIAEYVLAIVQDKEIGNFGRPQEINDQKGTLSDVSAKSHVEKDPGEYRDVANADEKKADGDDDSDADSATSEEEDDFLEIEHIDKFLRRGRPLQALLVALRILRLPGQIRDIINTVPRRLIVLSSRSEISLLNRMKLFLEDYTGCYWDWYPLRQPTHDVAPGNIRIKWTLFGRERETEVSENTAQVLDEILGLLEDHPPKCYCCSSRQTTPITWSRVIKTATGPLPLSNSTTGTASVSRNTASASSTAANKYTPSTSGTMPSGAHRLSERGNRASKVPSAENTSQSNSTKSLRVLFAVQGWRWSLELEQILVSVQSSDCDFFRELRVIHRAHRRAIIDMLSPYRFMNCKFVKLHRFQPNRVRSAASPALPEDYQQGPHYEYDPRPPRAKLPLIDQGDFEILLGACRDRCWWPLLVPWHDCITLRDDDYFLRKIPKKRDICTILHGGPSSEPEAFGIQADYVLSFGFLAVYHFVPLLLSFGFWAYWLATHSGDLQNASVPVAVVLALIATFWTMIDKKRVGSF